MRIVAFPAQLRSCYLAAGGNYNWHLLGKKKTWGSCGGSTSESGTRVAELRCFEGCKKWCLFTVRPIRESAAQSKREVFGRDREDILSLKSCV